MGWNGTYADGVGRVAVLDRDAELADSLSDTELREARKVLLAPRVTLAQGRWDPPFAAAAGCLGLLVLDGLLTRQVALGETTCAELLGPGDLLRPWDRLESKTPQPLRVTWRVQEETELAILSERFAGRAARWPAVASALTGRVMRRANTLALSQAIGSTTGLDTRLLTLFWHFAERWGRVRADGVLLSLPITHETIARLIGARRPSVSTTLKLLERDGKVRREGRGAWLLAHHPSPSAPADLAQAA